jgi:hypothetical protein
MRNWEHTMNTASKKQMFGTRAVMSVVIIIVLIGTGNTLNCLTSVTNYNNTNNMLNPKNNSVFKVKPKKEIYFKFMPIEMVRWDVLDSDTLTFGQLYTLMSTFKNYVLQRVAYKTVEDIELYAIMRTILLKKLIFKELLLERKYSYQEIEQLRVLMIEVLNVLSHNKFARSYCMFINNIVTKDKLFIALVDFYDSNYWESLLNHDVIAYSLLAQSFYGLKKVLELDSQTIKQSALFKEVIREMREVIYTKLNHFRISDWACVSQEEINRFLIVLDDITKAFLSIEDLTLEYSFRFLVNGHSEGFIQFDR